MLNQLPHFIKTRIAPTPSGFLHLGNALSFALTAALARKTGAKVLLRIDDLDQQRVNPDYVQDIFDTLEFMQIPCNQGPRNMAEYKSEWSQLHRMELYRSALQQLQQQGKVFACECSRSQLTNGIYPGTCLNKAIPLDAPHTNWRLYTDERDIAIKTLDKGTITTRLPDTMKYFIIKKKDGYPAYQLTSVLDDIHFEIDLVVRGQDLWPSTIAQHYLAGVLQLDAFQNITFHHHTLLMGPGAHKLSKSAGATSIKYLREMGKNAEDVYKEINDLTLLYNK